jgi:isochorismate synthase EntC
VSVKEGRRPICLAISIVYGPHSKGSSCSKLYRASFAKQRSLSARFPIALSFGPSQENCMIHSSKTALTVNRETYMIVLRLISELQRDELHRVTQAEAVDYAVNQALTQIQNKELNKVVL